MKIIRSIRNLSSAERERLMREVPALFPELDGDAVWERIIRDPRPRPALTALLDEAEAEFKRNPAVCPDTSEAEFDRCFST